MIAHASFLLFFDFWLMCYDSLDMFKSDSGQSFRNLLFIHDTGNERKFYLDLTVSSSRFVDL